MSITVGETVRLSADFFDSDVPTDPTTVTLAYTDPSGNVTTYVYDAPASIIVRSDTGSYYADIVPDEAGRWEVTWTPTGPVVATTDSVFDVDPLPVLVTITAQTSAPVPITGALVQLFAVSGAVFGAGVTGSAGTAKVTVPPGEYQLEVAKKKVVFPAASMITVTDSNGAPQGFSVEGTVLAISDPTPPVRIRLFGYMAGRDGAPVSQTVIVETLGAGFTKDFVQPGTPATGLNPASTMVARSKWSVLVDSAGYWETDVVVGSRVRVWIPETHFEVIFTVPGTTTTLNIADVMVDLGFRPQDQNPSPQTF
jgi:YD repeat-containing protein